MVDLCKASNEEITKELRRREEEETLKRRNKLLEELQYAQKDNRITSIYRDNSEDKIVYHVFTLRK